MFNYEWSPDGKYVAYTTGEPESKQIKDRKEYMADFNIVRKEYSFTHIRIFDVSKSLINPVAGTLYTKGRDYSVSGFTWSHDGTRIAFSGAHNPDFVNSHTRDIYVLNLADTTVKKVVDLTGPDRVLSWSPDDSQLLISTYNGKQLYYALNSELAVVPADGGSINILTSRFDENPGFVTWNIAGIYFSGSQKTASHLFFLNIKNKNIKRLTKPDNLIAGSFSFTKDGKMISFTAESPVSLREVYISKVKDFAAVKLTNFTNQAGEFSLGSREVVSWESRDGTLIEGVLVKPVDFNPEKTYPLLCIIHGGPTGIDRPVLLSRGLRYYPVDIWAGRGALILRVNYRGSAGYGEKFRRLNMRNLGVGDAWDVVSGVQSLIDKGWVDPDRVGCMGWSQGGYISAFLTTSSDKFAAISVGAGISNWATYYYNTDITPFTINYLGDNPAEDPEIYQKTSPMSYIKNAKTPTMIQHGEFDRRVPIPNAYELRQGLEDQNVPVEMIVYKGFGHGINKPKSMRAVMWHNLVWFNHYIWGDDLPDMTKPDIPDKKDDKKSATQKTNQLKKN